MLAVWAHAVHLDLVPDYGVVGGFSGPGFDVPVHGNRQVADPAAPNAADVIVLARVSVVANRLIGGMHLTHQALIGETAQIPIHRAEANLGEAPSGLPVDPLCGRVLKGGAHHFEDHVALPGLSRDHN